MIVSYREAIEVYLKIPSEKKSFYYHPSYVALDAQEKNLKPIFFCITDSSNNIFYHAFHLGKIDKHRVIDIQSPYGYGGPIINGDKEFMVASYNKYIQWCKDNKILVEFIRFHPVIQNKECYLGETLFNRETVVVEVNNVKELIKSYSKRVRAALKIATNQQVIIVENKTNKEIDNFYNTYTSLMEGKKTSDEYIFSAKYFYKLIKNKEVILINAYSKDNCYLGGAIFFNESYLADYHLSATNQKGRDYNITSLLIHHFATKIESKKLHLGGGLTQSNEDSLLFFKKGFSKKIVHYSIGYRVYDKRKYYNLKTQFSNKQILYYR